MRIKILTIVYIFILAGIIVLADLKGTQYLLNFVRFVPYGDKVGHFFLMGMFSLMLNLALNARTFRLWKIQFLLGTLIVLIVVTIEEFSQKFIRGRSFDLTDLVVDFAGIFIFGELARLICRKFFKKDLPQGHRDF
ncbi:MAG: VanZ family protein [Pyrinomonadaceae bacterium]